MPVSPALFLIIVLALGGPAGAVAASSASSWSLLGTFSADAHLGRRMPHFLPTRRLLGALAATGVILGAIYLLTCSRR